jgi:hypothetical protein
VTPRELAKQIAHLVACAGAPAVADALMKELAQHAASPDVEDANYKAAALDAANVIGRAVYEFNRRGIQ